MASRHLVAGWLALAAAIGPGSSARAQTRVLVVAADFESPTLLAPVGLLSIVSEQRTSTLGFIGSTVTAQQTRNAGPERSIVLRADLTPFNANASRYVYSAGVRVDSLEFRDRSLALSAGLRFGLERLWAEVRAIGLYESVGNLPDSLLPHWRAPFVGLGARIGARRLVSDDPLAARSDGVAARPRASRSPARVPGGGRRSSRAAGEGWVGCSCAPAAC